MTNQQITLAIVVPCFNEEDILLLTSKRLVKILTNIPYIKKTSFILFVDDGSNDKTWSIIQNLASEQENIRGIKLSNNFGHQNALYCGLIQVKDQCDCAISIDADLQQDETKIPEFLEEYSKGNQIVYGVRYNRQIDNLSKKYTANLFYHLMQKVGVHLFPHHADYRLISQQVLEALSSFQEYNLFLRGLFPFMGFSHSFVYHEVKKRKYGQSKYTLPKMLSFAFNGITSFSIFPIRFITIFGLLVSIFSIIMAFFYFLSYFFDDTVPGWASIIVAVFFLGGVQLISIGIVGEYIGKTYMESKKRPIYIIEEKC